MIRSVLLGKDEGPYRVDSVPDAANDAMLVGDLSWGFDGVRMVKRPSMTLGTLDKLADLHAGDYFTFSGFIEVRGSGVAGTPPKEGAILRHCGMAQTIVALTSVAYSPVSQGHLSGSYYLYEEVQGGVVRFEVVGCRGDIGFDLATADGIRAPFTMKGHLVGITDVAMPSPTLITAPGPKVLSSAFTIGGYSGLISKLNIALNGDVQPDEDINQANGYGEMIIGDRDVSGSFDPRAMTIAAKDFIGEFRNSTASAIAVGPVGAPGNQVAFALPAITPRELSPGERAGKRTYENGFGAAASSGDDSMTMTLT